MQNEQDTGSMQAESISKELVMDNQKISNVNVKNDIPQANAGGNKTVISANETTEISNKSERVDVGSQKPVESSSQSDASVENHGERSDVRDGTSDGGVSGDSSAENQGESADTRDGVADGGVGGDSTARSQGQNSDTRDGLQDGGVSGNALDTNTQSAEDISMASGDSANGTNAGKTIRVEEELTEVARHIRNDTLDRLTQVQSLNQLIPEKMNEYYEAGLDAVYKKLNGFEGYFFPNKEKLEWVAFLNGLGPTDNFYQDKVDDVHNLASEKHNGLDLFSDHIEKATRDTLDKDHEVASEKFKG